MDGLNMSFERKQECLLNYFPCEPVFNWISAFRSSYWYYPANSIHDFQRYGRMRTETPHSSQNLIAKRDFFYSAPRNDTDAFSSGRFDREISEKINHFGIEKSLPPALPDVIRPLSSTLPATSGPRMKPFVSIIPPPPPLLASSSNGTSDLKIAKPSPQMHTDFRSALLTSTSDNARKRNNLPAVPTAQTESYAARLSARTLAPPPASVASDSDEPGRRKRRNPQQGRGRLQRGRSQASRITVENLVG